MNGSMDGTNRALHDAGNHVAERPTMPKGVVVPGKILEVEFTAQKLSISTEGALVELQVYSAGIVRVRMTKKELHGFARDFSYAVVGAVEACTVDFSEDEGEIKISTEIMVAVIQKCNCSISFYSLDGRLINEDVSGLGVSWVGHQVTAYKALQPGEHFIGLGEKTGNLDRKGTGYSHWNTDVYGYRVDQDPLYSTIPFYIGVHSQLNYGIFFDNTYRSDFNFGASNNRFASFGAEGGEMNYYFIYQEKLGDIIRDYTALTGRMTMPPLWSLGYQQNRYSYYPDTEVLRIAKTLREKRIPADGITLDIHYMEKYKLFTWDKKRFPHPVVMNKELEAMGFKTTVIVDPGIKVERGYSAYEDGIKQDIFLKYLDGTQYTAQVWPGWCNFPDFTSEKGRNWWKEKVKLLAEAGVDGIWNDMNEIASWGNKMPFNILFDYDGEPITTIGAHNVYALEMIRASYEGARASFGKRPFLLTRSGYAGLQRYSAIWTGDNRAEDTHMIAGVRLLTSLGLSGVAFTGMDVGGFIGDTSTELFTRWIQIGAFTPYFRNHKAVNMKSSEPWCFGEEATEIARNFISLRYKLLPYIYAAFFKATKDGLPVMKSLTIDYSFDELIYDTRYQNQYLFGANLLVLPFESKQEFGEAYFPAGKWYDFFTGELQEGRQEKIIKLAYHRLPVFVKESSIIPMQTLIQSTAEQPGDTLFLHVYHGSLDNDYTYYEDDGETYGYEQGDYYTRKMCYDAAQRKLIFSAKEGRRSSKFLHIKLMMHGFDKEATFTINGQGVHFKAEFVSLLKPISKFDPQGVANSAEGETVLSHSIKNVDHELIIRY